MHSQDLVVTVRTSNMPQWRKWSSPVLLQRITAGACHRRASGHCPAHAQPLKSLSSCTPPSGHFRRQILQHCSTRNADALVPLGRHCTV